MKMGSQRGAVSAAAVLEAPETMHAPTAGVKRGGGDPNWRAPEPAPAGALQRGYAADVSDSNSYNQEEEEYRPRRGASGMRLNLRGLLRSTGGRIVLGTVTVVSLGLMAVGFAVARSYVLHDPRFVLASSDDIQIGGNSHLSREQLLSVFGGDLERNIFRVSLSERRANLERLPWVEHATVMRLLPNRLRVEVTERTPVAFVRQGTQIGLVDASGVLLDMATDASVDGHYSFPVLTGIAAADPLSTRAARMEIYERFLKDLDSTGKGFSKSVSEVDVTDPEDVKALVAAGNSEVLVHFGDELFLTRYNEFEKHLPEWKQQYPKLASADMRYEGQIVLEMRKDGGDVAAAPAAIAPASVAAPNAGLSAAVPPRSTSGRNERAVEGMKARVLPVSANVKASAKSKSAAKKAAVKPAVAKKTVAKKVVAKKVAGKSAANERMYAALAAQRKAADAKAHSGGAQ
jgi:cell division protein FtsQ